MSSADADTPNYMSHRASNACIFVTYVVFLVVALGLAYYYRNKKQYLSGNGTRSAIPLAANFIASGLGAGILVTYPQIAAFGGLHGLLVYAITSAVPLLLFSTLGPIIRRQSPEGFVLTEWIRQRYGVATALLISCCTVLTLFLFMVSELTAVQEAVQTLTGLNGLAALIVESVFTAIYTSFGGFYVSFFTDNIQALMFLAVFIVCICAMGTNAHIDKALVGPSGLLKGNKLSWKLLYILLIAIVTNDCFMAGFWLRTFASRSDRDLWIACIIAAVVVFLLLSVVGVTGLIAVWSGLLDPSSDTFEDDSEDAFYLVLLQMPRWVHGFVLVFVVAMSMSGFDSMQSAMASTISNDFFRNRVRMVWIRLFILALIAPTVIVALRSPNVLNIYLIADILSSCVIPVLFLGLSRRFFFLTGFEVFMSVIGGILTVFIFGTIYYHSASAGGGLLLLEQGLYGDDWGAFGAFVAAPVGSFIGGFVGLVIRGLFIAIREKRLFAVFDLSIARGNFDDGLWKWESDLPWYERWQLGAFGEKLDRLIFVPNGETIVNESLLHRDYAHSDSDRPSVASDIDRKDGALATTTDAPPLGADAPPLELRTRKGWNFGRLFV